MFKKIALSALLAVIFSITAFSSPLLGSKAPEFSLPDINGVKHSLSQYRGKIVLLDIWAAWCGPCRQAMPKNEQLHRKYASRGLVVLAVNIEGRNSNAPAYIKSNNFTFKVLYSEGNWSSPVVKSYGVEGIPFVALIDRNGVIRFVGHPSSITETLIENALKGSLPDVRISQITKAIFELEKYINWEAQKQEWKTTGRKNWVQKLSDAQSVESIKTLIIEVEKSFNANSLNQNWAAKRPEWIKKIQKAKKVSELAAALIDFIPSINSSAMHQKWGEVLEGWKRAVMELSR